MTPLRDSENDRNTSAVTGVELFSDYSNLSENDSTLPTVRLSESAQVDGQGSAAVSAAVGVIGVVSEDELPATTPTVTAENIDTSQRDVDLEGGFSTRVLDHSGKRAEFISATIYKATQTTPVGATFLSGSQDENGVKIHAIKQGSLAAETPLQSGDIILSINNKNCSELDGRGVSLLIRKAIGKVTIIVRNENNGEPNFVQSMVARKNPNQTTCGLSLKNGRNNAIIVAKVEPRGLFADSLINRGDQILAVNDISCLQLSAKDVAIMLQQAKPNVNVLTKTQRETGVVLAQLSSRRVVAGTTVASYAVGDHNSGNNDADAQRQKEMAMARVVGLVLVLVVGLTILSLGVGGAFQPDDDYYT